MFERNRIDANVKFSADGGIGGGGSRPSYDLLNTVLQELRETYSRNKWTGDAADTVKGYIALYVPAEQHTVANTMTIVDQLSSLINTVGKHCKGNDERISAETAVALIVEAYELGVVNTLNGTITAVQAFSSFVAHSSSISDEIGRARSAKRPAPVAVSTVTEGTRSVVESTSAPEATGSSTKISTKVNEFALSVGWTPERVTALMATSGLTEGDLDDIKFWASGTGKTNPKTGELIVRKDKPSYTDPDAILSLIEEGAPAKVVILLVEMKRLLDGYASVPDLIDGADLLKMTVNDFIKKVLNSPNNLELDDLTQFCDEFGFDLDAVIGHREYGGRTETEDITDESVAQEIAEAILTAMECGEGKTLGQKLRSFVRESRDHGHNRGDVTAIAQLFERK